MCGKGLANSMGNGNVSVGMIRVVVNLSADANCKGRKSSKRCERERGCFGLMSQQL